MAQSYSHLYRLPVTALASSHLRAVGRPDMALFLFANAITAGKPIRSLTMAGCARLHLY